MSPPAFSCFSRFLHKNKIWPRPTRDECLFRLTSKMLQRTQQVGRQAERRRLTWYLFSSVKGVPRYRSENAEAGSDQKVWDQ